MKISKIFAVVIVCFPPGLLVAGGIYKWRDEQGQVHYSATPPAKQKIRKIGETAGIGPEYKSKTRRDNSCSREEFIVGNWDTEYKGQILNFNFSEKSRYVDQEIYHQKYIVRIGQWMSQSGEWSIEKSNMTFTVKESGKGIKEFNEFHNALVVNANEDNLYLLIKNTNGIKLKRDSSPGDLPDCMRSKR